MSLAEIFEDDSYVHVDDNQVGYHDERHHVEYGQAGGAAVPVLVLHFSAVRHGPELVIAVRRPDEHRIQNVVPSGWRGQTEQEEHAVAEGVEVDDVVDDSAWFEVAEESHAENGIDERDEE